MGCCQSQILLEDARAEKQTAVVTGSEEGIGLEVVRELVKRGCRVIMACRDVGKAENAAKEIRQETASVAGVGVVVVVRLDLSSLASVRQCAAQLLQTEPSINLLINNAVVLPCRKTLTEDGFELQFAVNHLGHFLLTLLLLPRIQKSAPARIINLTSEVHYEGKINFKDLNSEKSYDKNAAFYQSKLANILFTIELSRRLQAQRQCLETKFPYATPRPESVAAVTTYAVHPGHMTTDYYLSYVDRDCCFYPMCKCLFGCSTTTAEEAGKRVVYCAVDEAAGQQTGLYYSSGYVSQASSKARNSATAQELWDESLKMVGLNYDPFTAADTPPIAQPGPSSGPIIVQSDPSSGPIPAQPNASSTPILALSDPSSDLP